MSPKLHVLNQDIATTSTNGVEYINITDIARYKNKDRTGVIIGNWLRNRNTIEFLSIWEQLNNANFNVIEFDDIKKRAGLNSFTLTAKEWIEKTGAIKQNLIPDAVSAAQINSIYASEADLLNVALFGVTAAQWRALNPDLSGNMRDHATMQQLVCLANLESLNAHFIQQELTQSQRLAALNELAIKQMNVLVQQHAALDGKNDG